MEEQAQPRVIVYKARSVGLSVWQEIQAQMRGGGFNIEFVDEEPPPDAQPDSIVITRTISLAELSAAYKQCMLGISTERSFIIGRDPARIPQPLPPPQIAEPQGDSGPCKVHVWRRTKSRDIRCRRCGQRKPS